MPRVGWLVAIGSVLVACAAVGHSDERARDDEAALLATLDRLVALERRDGAWTFAAAPHTRPAPSTMVVDGTCVKVLAWYDNEIGYVHRMIELAEKVGASL